MNWIIKFKGKEIGRVMTNHRMTDEEICDFARVSNHSGRF